METGIFSWFGYPLSNEERLQKIAAVGFTRVMLWWGDEFAATDGAKEDALDLARRYGLYVDNIHTPFEGTNLLWLDKIGWEDIVQRYLDCVDDCCTYQIPTMVLHLTSGDTPPPVSELGIDRIKRIVERAEQKKVVVALENVRRPEYLEAVFRAVDSEYLRFCYDSGHENCFSQGTDLLTQYGGKLAALHLHDNDGSDDQHRIPGFGNIDWSTWAKKMKLCGYQGAVTLEVTNEFSPVHTGLSAEQFLEQAYSRAIDLVNRIEKA